MPQVLRSTSTRAALAILFAALLVLTVVAPAVAHPGKGGKPPGKGNPTGPQRYFELTVLHVNDGESALLPTENVPGAARFAADLQKLQKQAERDRLPRQASSRAKAIQRHRVPRAALTISAGDNYLAGPRLNASLEDPDAFYDALIYTHTGFDAMTIGNHEFDFGPDVLADFIEATGDIPFISANLDVSAEPRLAALADAGRIAASTVVEKEGRRIGIVGATTEQLPNISSPRDVVVSEVLPAVQAEVAALEADGVQIILLSSHLQDLNEELSLVPHLSGVDAVIGGGGGEALGDDYPLFATDADGKQVPVVTTPGAYTDIGKLVLRFDRHGELLAVGDDSALVSVRLEGKRDRFIAKRVEKPVQAYVAELESNVIAETVVPLDGRRQGPGVRDRETNLGNLMADAHLLAARSIAGELGVPPADIALQNGGGMRQEAIIPPGPVTELDTFDIAAFANFIAIGQVDGVALKSALERSVAAQPGAAGFHGQWAGVSFNYDTSRQAQQIDDLAGVVTQEGDRIVDAVVTRADGTTVTLVDDGVLVGGDEVFTIASIDFILRDGGDGYFSLEVPITTTTITYQESLARRFEELGTVTDETYPDLSVDADLFTRHGPVARFSPVPVPIP